MPIDAEHPKGVELYDFEDHDTHRGLIFDGMKDTLERAFPQTHNNVRVSLSDVHYADDGDPDFSAQKNAILGNQYLTRRLRGTVVLHDDTTGDLLDSKTLTLMRVPYLTGRGTFIHGGNEYASISQSRLLPGAYTRRQKNGELETQFNVRAGSGSAFRIGFEPESSQYRMKVQNANLHLYSLLHDLGIPDEDLETSWGTQVLDMNRGKYDSRVLDKAYQRMVPSWETKLDATREEKAEAIRSALDASQIHERVARRNLPNMFDMSKAAEWRKAAEDNEAAEREAQADFDRWLVKNAVFSSEDLRAVAVFLNTEHQAGLNVDADASELEQQIMNFIDGGAAGVSPAMLTAGIEGLRDVQEAQDEWGKQAADSEIVHLPQVPVLLKLARYGAGVLFKQPNGKYLLQENREGDTDDPDKVGKLRPAGGGKHKTDPNLRATILREMNEEFGLPPDETTDKLVLLGYNTVKGPFRDCALFQMEDHGLSPGLYRATNSDTEVVKLVEADLDDPRYIGPKLTQLRRYALRGYRGRGTKQAEEDGRDMTEWEAAGFVISSEEGLRRSDLVDKEHTPTLDEL